MRQPNDDKEWIRWIRSSSPGSSADAAAQIEVWIKSALDQISWVVDEVTEFLKLCRCFAGDLRDVQLALREAVLNAVLHGNRMNPDKVVRVHCRCAHNEGLSIVVTDEGMGFAPERVRNPLAVENLALDQGRGIHLMKLLMDEI